ncbi:MAG: hypothetical protein OXF46_06580 [Rhodobacteraceae bacterium]|nr:hypothetical protein [Paracoccaceae bacterium]
MTIIGRLCFWSESIDPLIRISSPPPFGLSFTRKELRDTQKTVALLPVNNRNKLVKTICEHLNWYTPEGSFRKHAALAVWNCYPRKGCLHSGDRCFSGLEIWKLNNI